MIRVLSNAEKWSRTLRESTGKSTTKMARLELEGRNGSSQMYLIRYLVTSQQLDLLYLLIHFKRRHHLIIMLMEMMRVMMTDPYERAKKLKKKKRSIRYSFSFT